MKDAVTSWIVRAMALVVFGPIAAQLWTNLRAPDGSFHATPMTGTDRLEGVFALLALGFVGVLAAGLGAKVLHRREGMMLSGFVMGWVAWASVDMDAVYVSVGGSGVFLGLAVEGVLMLLNVVLILNAAMRAGSAHGGASDPFLGAGDLFVSLKENGSKSVPVLVVSTVSVMAVTWLQVQSGLSGQALWGAAIGGMLAGLVSGFVGHSKGETKTKVLVPSVLGVALAGVLAPLVTMFMVSGDLGRAVASGSLPGWAMVPSVGWACGALFGVPIGYGAVLGSIEKHGGLAASKPA